MQEFNIHAVKKFKKKLLVGFGPDQKAGSQMAGSLAQFGGQFRPGTFPTKPWIPDGYWHVTI